MAQDDDFRNEVGDARSLFEAEQSALLGRPDITPEVSMTLTELDMEVVAEAGGVAEGLRRQVIDLERGLTRLSPETPSAIRERVTKTVEAKVASLKEALKFVQGESI